MWTNNLFRRIFCDKVDSKELHEAFQKMNKQLEEKGGHLTFSITIDQNGWFAQCKEFSGIMSGGESKNPSEEEMTRSIIDSVKTAFHVPIKELEMEIESRLNLKTIKHTREAVVFAS